MYLPLVIPLKNGVRNKEKSSRLIYIFVPYPTQMGHFLDPGDKIMPSFLGRNVNQFGPCISNLVTAFYKRRILKRATRKGVGVALFIRVDLPFVL